MCAPLPSLAGAQCQGITHVVGQPKTISAANRERAAHPRARGGPPDPGTGLLGTEQAFHREPERAGRPDRRAVADVPRRPQQRPQRLGVLSVRRRERVPHSETGAPLPPTGLDVALRLLQGWAAGDQPADLDGERQVQIGLVPARESVRCGGGRPAVGVAQREFGPGLDEEVGQSCAGVRVGDHDAAPQRCVGTRPGAASSGRRPQRQGPASPTTMAAAVPRR